jgi:hypothetical protein
MPFESQKIMFEIYREECYSRRFRAVYFTELNEYNKESEINAALAGEHFLDGFIREISKDQAKRTIATVLDRLNRGEGLGPNEVQTILADYLAA